MKTKVSLPPNCREVADCIYELSPDFRAGMRVPVRLIADGELLGAGWSKGEHGPANEGSVHLAMTWLGPLQSPSISCM